MQQSLLDNAIRFAVAAHSGARRKGRNIPYILHPLEAAAIVSSMTEDLEVIAAAVLHDVLEDTDAAEDDLLKAFGARVTRLVRAESEDKRSGSDPRDTWLARKREAIDALKNETDIAVKMIMLGDKLSNMRAFREGRRLEGDRLWDRFNQKDPKMQAWYYSSIADATSELKDFTAWQEYLRLVREVFGDSSLT